MARETNEYTFILKWEEYIPKMSISDVDVMIAQLSPHHPNSNMAWLYDRMIAEKVSRLQ